MEPGKTNFNQNDVKPRVLMSTLGRSHFIVAADALVRHGVDLDLLQGWVPRNLNSWTVKICARIINRKSFVIGLSKRMTPALKGHIIAEPLPELINTVFQLFGSKISDGFFNWGLKVSFSLYGRLTCRHLQHQNIFHLKSGLGQGGAINKARRLGMKILVDQGALYPATTEKNLHDDCLRWREPVCISAEKGVWINVVKDCRNADLILVNAQHIKESFVQNGYCADRIRVIYLGVRADFLFLKREYRISKQVTVLFSGTFSILKGCEYLLESFAILQSKSLPVHYSVVGGISNRVLKDSYLKLPVSYYGHLSQDELKSHLATADIYLFPSLADGCASSGMEALGAGLCVVATKESGLPITDGETGFLVPMKDAKAIAAKIEWLIAHPEEIERVGRNAAKMIATEYTWEKYAENVEKVYRELLA